MPGSNVETPQRVKVSECAISTFSRYARATHSGGLLSGFLFLLPGGRPRRLLLSCDSHTGGRPRRFAPPKARRSRLAIASSNCARSVRISSKILLISIITPDYVEKAVVFGPPAIIIHWSAF